MRRLRRRSARPLARYSSGRCGALFSRGAVASSRSSRPSRLRFTGAPQVTRASRKSRATTEGGRFADDVHVAETCDAAASSCTCLTAPAMAGRSSACSRRRPLRMQASTSTQEARRLRADRWSHRALSSSAARHAPRASARVCGAEPCTKGTITASFGPASPAATMPRRPSRSTASVDRWASTELVLHAPEVSSRASERGVPGDGGAVRRSSMTVDGRLFARRGAAPCAGGTCAPRSPRSRSSARSTTAIWRALPAPHEASGSAQDGIVDGRTCAQARANHRDELREPDAHLCLERDLHDGRRSVPISGFCEVSPAAVHDALHLTSTPDTTRARGRGRASCWRHVTTPSMTLCCSRERASFPRACAPERDRSSR